MDFLPTPFDFEDSLTDNELDIFTECIVFDEFGDFSGYRNYDYMSEIVERVLNGRHKTPLDRNEPNFVARYSTGIKKVQESQKNAKVAKEVSIVTQDKDAEYGNPYGTINENLVTRTSREGGLFEDSDSIEETDSIQYSLDKYNEIKPVFQRIEGVDLDTLLVRALQGVPKAVSVLRDLVHKYKFLGEIVEDVMTARADGNDILPIID